MMLRLLVASALLLFYDLSFVDSAADSSSVSTVEYNLVNTSDALLKYMPDLKNRVKFEDGQMTFTMNGKPDSFSGILVSDSGNLEMTMEPLDFEAERTGDQKLTLELPAGDINFGFSWKQTADGDKKFDLDVTGAKKIDTTHDVKSFKVDYNHAGNFTGATTIGSYAPAAYDKSDKLRELKGLEAKDGKQLINFTLQWSNQASDFQLVFGQGIFLATIPQPLLESSTGNSHLLAINSLSTSPESTTSADSSSSNMLIIGIIGGIVAFAFFIGLGIFVYCKFFKKKKTASPNAPSAAASCTTATPSTPQPSNENKPDPKHTPAFPLQTYYPAESKVAEYEPICSNANLPPPPQSSNKPPSAATAQQPSIPTAVPPTLATGRERKEAEPLISNKNVPKPSFSAYPASPVNPSQEPLLPNNYGYETLGNK